MKKMRRLIPAIAMLLVSAVMLSTASFAWFTISTSAKATGMTVSAMASSSLLIVNGTDAEAGDPDATFMTSNGIAEFSTAGEDLKPATHEDAQTGTVNSATGLVYITNAENAIDPNSGNVKDDVDATFAAAVNGTSTTYYIDYVVYLGTAGGDFANKTLNAYVTVDASKMATLHNAIAVDFLIGNQDTAVDANGKYTVLKGYEAEGETKDGLEYVNTTWLSAAAANATTGAKVELGAGSLVPVAVSTTTSTDAQGNETTATDATGDFMVVVMRIYFDGDHQMGQDGAYVRDAYTTDKTCGFNVTFKVE